LAAKVVHPCEWIIKTFEPYKVPEPDGIFPVFLLKEGLNALLDLLTRVLRASIVLRHVSQAWSGKVVFLSKLGRNDHIF